MAARAHLAREHALDVTLWLDDLAALARMAPGVDPERSQPWTASTCAAARPLPRRAADVVIEAFGCGLPDDYVARMAAARGRRAWIILEYLSAEPWVEGAHGLAVAASALPLARRFWFPGFTAHRRTPARARSPRRARRFAGRHRVARVPVARLGSRARRRRTRVSLFCYPNPVLPALLDAWADGEPSYCVVPEGVAAGALDRVDRRQRAAPGAHPSRAADSTLHAVPFVAQDDYDRLLWASDVNFVRGEDSFVRAQWAARPFVWHIYPQAERRASGEARRLSRSLRGGARPGRRRARSAVLATPGTAPPAAGRSARRGALRRRPPPLARHGELGPRALAACPISPTGWSRLPRTGIIEGFPNQPPFEMSGANGRSRNSVRCTMKIAQEIRAGNVIMVGKDPMVVQKAEFTSPAATRRSSR